METDPVSTYFEVLQQGSGGTSDSRVEAKALSTNEQAVLKALLQAQTRRSKTTDLVAASGLGLMELGDAIRELTKRGVVRVEGRGEAEQVAVA